MAEEDLITPIKQAHKPLSPKMIDFLIGAGLCIPINLVLCVVMLVINRMVGSILWHINPQFSDTLVPYKAIVDIAIFLLIFLINGIIFLVLLPKRPLISLGMLVAIPVVPILLIILSTIFWCLMGLLILFLWFLAVFISSGFRLFSPVG